MAKPVVMPQMGESVAEGTIVRWLKKVGDAVERDEPLFEISTDKVDAEIPSPAAGVVSEVKVKEGETVPINTVVAVIDETASKPAAAAKPAKRRAKPAQAAAPAHACASAADKPSARSRTCLRSSGRRRYFGAFRSLRACRTAAPRTQPPPSRTAAHARRTYCTTCGSARTRRTWLWRSHGRRPRRASCGCRRSCERSRASITSMCATLRAAATAAA